MKRVIIATILGLAAGLACYSLASSSGDLPTPVALQIVLSRTLIGFAIGISSLNLAHWSLHGLIFGFIFSLPLAFSGLMAEHEQFSPTTMFMSTVFMGAVYGLITEVITSVVFKAPQYFPRRPALN